VLLASDRGLERLGREPLARIVSSAVAGVDPALMGMGPVPAVRRALERAALTVDDVEVVELNEAFASQSLACMRELGLDAARVNPNGGAIARAHRGHAGLGDAPSRRAPRPGHHVRRGRPRRGAGAREPRRGLSSSRARASLPRPQVDV
jgi:hypothetical protein